MCLLPPADSSRPCRHMPPHAQDVHGVPSNELESGDQDREAPQQCEDDRSVCHSQRSGCVPRHQEAVENEGHVGGMGELPEQARCACGMQLGSRARRRHQGRGQGRGQGQVLEVKPTRVRKHHITSTPGCLGPCQASSNTWHWMRVQAVPFHPAPQGIALLILLRIQPCIAHKRPRARRGGAVMYITDLKAHVRAGAEPTDIHARRPRAAGRCW